jgi:hypothetical protein
MKAQLDFGERQSPQVQIFGQTMMDLQDPIIVDFGIKE